jgi:hypothetical protein
MTEPRLANSLTITKFPVTIRLHISKGKLIGYYITAKAFPMGCPQLDREQWIGLHQGYMVATLGRPTEARTLMFMQSDLPEIVGVGNITWLGQVKCYPTKLGASLYVPLWLWSQQETTKQTTTGHGEAIHSKSNRVYVLLHLPTVKPICAGE